MLSKLDQPAKPDSGASPQQTGNPTGAEKHRWWSHVVQEGSSVLGIVGLILVWALAVRIFHIPEYLLPSPAAIAVRILKDWRMLMDHSLVTGWEVILGFGFSVLLGIPLAVGIVYSPVFERIAYGLIVSSQTIPKVALAPLIVVWVGFGLASKVLIAFLIAFFPIVINTVVGMRSIDVGMIHLARSLGARPLAIFLKFRLPTALPVMFGGFRVAVTLAVVGAIVGEFISGNKGLGYVQLNANGNMDTVLLYTTVVVLSALGLFLFGVVAGVERLVVHWRPHDTHDPNASM